MEECKDAASGKKKRERKTTFHESLWEDEVEVWQTKKKGRDSVSG